jgi:hypothetical protein
VACLHWALAKIAATTELWCTIANGMLKQAVDTVWEWYSRTSQIYHMAASKYERGFARVCATLRTFLDLGAASLSKNINRELVDCTLHDYNQRQH